MKKGLPPAIPGYLMIPAGTHVMRLNIGNGCPANFFECRQMNVGKLIDIDTGFRHVVFSQIVQQVHVFGGCRKYIQRNGRFARRKTDDGRIATVAACIGIMVTAKPDDGRPPHFWQEPRPLAHEGNQLNTIRFLLLIVHKSVDEIRNGDGCFGGFIFGHG